MRDLIRTLIYKISSFMGRGLTRPSNVFLCSNVEEDGGCPGARPGMTAGEICAEMGELHISSGATM